MSKDQTSPNEEHLSQCNEDDIKQSSNNDQAVSEESHQITADEIVIHGLLSDMGRRTPNEDEMRVQAVMRAINEKKEVKPFWWGLLLKPQRVALGLSALVVCFIFSLVIQDFNSVHAASATLEKIIAAAHKMGDRTYSIWVIENYKEVHPSQRKHPEELDGARLYVRGPDQYVLMQKITNGGQRLTGCDGELAWAMRVDSPVHKNDKVHVSSDLSRFRSGLPGHQNELPFINLNDQLNQLQDKYEVELLPEAGREVEGRVMAGLLGIKKSRDVGGPKRIEIWADEQTGVIHRMIMDGMPRAKGGPRSLIMELISQTELPVDFYSHTSHHELNRKIRFE